MVRGAAFLFTVFLTFSALNISAANSATVGTSAWSDYGEVNESPPVNFFVGTWTHVSAPMGSGGKGNDYPFVFRCTEGYNLICVSGNIGYDATAGTWVYNANTMTGSGDHMVVYLNTTETVARDWVYVGWHFLRTGSRTITSEFVKFGLSAPAMLVAQDTVSETYTPINVWIGGSPYDWAQTYLQYARLYEMESVPGASEIDAIAMRTTPDETAWGDWSLINASTLDLSGNGRDAIITGSWYSGITGPFWSTPTVVNDKNPGINNNMQSVISSITHPVSHKRPEFNPEYETYDLTGRHIVPSYQRSMNTINNLLLLLKINNGYGR